MFWVDAARVPAEVVDVDIARQRSVPEQFHDDSVRWPISSFPTKVGVAKVVVPAAPRPTILADKDSIRHLRGQQVEEARLHLPFVRSISTCRFADHTCHASVMYGFIRRRFSDP